jgi:hypothetical protein
MTEEVAGISFSDRWVKQRKTSVSVEIRNREVSNMKEKH